jgi:hypothetical protein
VLLAIGVPMIVAKQVADRGGAIEAKLFAKWGAAPTTAADLEYYLNDPTGSPT